MIQSTSREAYTQTNLTREDMCQTLQALYRTGDFTDKEAGEVLGWHSSEVSARRNDLGSIIKGKGRKKNTTGRSAIVWGLFKPTLF